MARVLVTGSTDGLGLAAVQDLVASGHQVTAHARAATRRDEVRDHLPGVEAVLVGDLASQTQTIALAEAAKRAAPQRHGYCRRSRLGHARVGTPPGYDAAFQERVLQSFAGLTGVQLPIRG